MIRLIRRNVNAVVVASSLIALQLAPDLSFAAPLPEPFVVEPPIIESGTSGHPTITNGAWVGQPPIHPWIYIGPLPIRQPDFAVWVRRQAKRDPWVLARINQITHEEPQKRAELAASLLALIYEPAGDPKNALRALQQDRLKTEYILGIVVTESSNRGVTAIPGRYTFDRANWKSWAYRSHGEHGVSADAWRFASGGSRLDLVAAIINRDGRNGTSAAAQAAVLSDAQLAEVRKVFLQVIAERQHGVEHFATDSRLTGPPPANDNRHGYTSSVTAETNSNSSSGSQQDRLNPGTDQVGGGNWQSSSGNGGVGGHNADAGGRNGSTGGGNDGSDGGGFNGSGPTNGSGAHAPVQFATTAHRMERLPTAPTAIFVLAKSCAPGWGSEVETAVALDNQAVLTGTYAGDTFLSADGGDAFTSALHRAGAIAVIEASAKQNTAFQLYVGCGARNSAYVKAPVWVRANKQIANVACSGKVAIVPPLRLTTPRHICISGRNTTFDVRPQRGQRIAAGSSRKHR